MSVTAHEAGRSRNGTDPASPVIRDEPATSQSEPATPQSEPATPQSEPATPQSEPATSQGEPVAPDEPTALARCVAVDAVTFAREHWGRAPLLSRAADLPAPFTDLLDLDDVDELLSRRGLRTPFLRIAKNGDVVDSRHFTGGAGAGAEIGDQVRDDQVLRLFASGSTVVLQALHRTWPAVVDFVGALTNEIGHPCQANAYVTPASSQGFSAHYDVHDVFVLQLAGTKHWKVHAPVHDDPLRSQPWAGHATAVARRAADDRPVIDAVLRPGDAMYLPRGYLHSAVAQGEVSAHLTVGVHTVTTFALVEALTATLAGDRELRRSLPMGVDVTDPDVLAPYVAAVVDAMRDALRRVRPADVAPALRDRVWPATRPEPVAPLATAAFADELDDSTRVRLRGGLRCAVDGATLRVPWTSIAFPAECAAALAAIASGDPVTVGDLPGLDAASQLVVARRLVREGVLTRCPM